MVSLALHLNTKVRPIRDVLAHCVPNHSKRQSRRQCIPNKSPRRNSDSRFGNADFHNRPDVCRQALELPGSRPDNPQPRTFSIPCITFSLMPIYHVGATRQSGRPPDLRVREFLCRASAPSRPTKLPKAPERARKKILTALDAEVMVRLAPTSKGVGAKSGRGDYVVWKAGGKTVAAPSRSCGGRILSGNCLR